MTRWIAAAVILAVLIIAGGSEAGQENDQDDPYLERLHKSNPDSLFVDYGQFECSISEEAVETMIDGILTRSRIKRLTKDEWVETVGFDQLFLDVSVSCNDKTFSVGVRFADMMRRHLTTDGWYGPSRLMYHTRPYGSFGLWGSDNEYLIGQIKAGVERALTDYMKANFDL